MSNPDSGERSSSGQDTATSTNYEALFPDNEGAIEPGPAYDIVVRNKEIERILDPQHRLPEADAYPILGATYSPADLGPKFQEGGLLPFDEAARQNKPVCLVLGVDGKIAASTQLTAQNGLPNNIFTVIDTSVGAGEDGTGKEWLGRGYGKRLYLELLRAMPPGAEITSHANLLPDGARMWDWLRLNGLATVRDGYNDGDVAGRYITQLNALDLTLDDNGEPKP